MRSLNVKEPVTEKRDDPPFGSTVDPDTKSGSQDIGVVEKVLNHDSCTSHLSNSLLPYFVLVPKVEQISFRELLRTNFMFKNRRRWDL